MNSSDLPLKKRATFDSDDVWCRLKTPVLNSSDSVHSLSGKEIQSPQCRRNTEEINNNRKEVEGSFVSKKARIRATMPHQITIFRFSLPDSDSEHENSSDFDEFEFEDEDVEVNDPEDEGVDENTDEDEEDPPFEET